MNSVLGRIGGVAGAIIVAMIIGALAGQSGDTIERLIALAGLYVTLAVSLNLINGITGQFSIGHAAFYQVGAYASGYLAVNFLKIDKLSLNGLTLPMLVGLMLVSAVIAGIAGFFIGLPSLRLRGDYLAIVTLGFGEILRIVVQNIPQIGGSYGMNVPRHESVALIWFLAIACIGLCRNLLQTSRGLTFLSVREDEVASGAMGVDVTKVKVTAFVIGSMFAGAAGALLGHYEAFITPNSFSMDVSFIVLTMVVLGGTGSITGSAIAAVLLFALPELLRDAPPASLPLVIGALCATGVLIAGLKKFQGVAHESRQIRTKTVAITVGGTLLTLLIGTALARLLPTLGNQTVPAANLRMVIFPVVLIAMMLLRPQGIFGHREIGWASFRFGKKGVKGAEA